MVVDAAATPTLASNIGPAKTGPTGPLAPGLLYTAAAIEFTNLAMALAFK